MLPLHHDPEKSFKVVRFSRVDMGITSNHIRVQEKQNLARAEAIAVKRTCRSLAETFRLQILL